LIFHSGAELKQQFEKSKFTKPTAWNAVHGADTFSVEALVSAGTTCPRDDDPPGRVPFPLEPNKTGQMVPLGLWILSKPAQKMAGISIPTGSESCPRLPSTISSFYNLFVTAF